MIHRDTIVALVVLAGTAALFTAISRMQDDAVIFIRVVVWAIGVLGLLLLVQSLLFQRRSGARRVMQGSDPKEKVSESKKPAIAWKPVALIFIGIIIYFWIMEWLGFYVSAFLYFVTMVFLLDWKGLTPKTGFVRVFSAFVFIAVIYVLFNKILLVQTPRGLLM